MKPLGVLARKIQTIGHEGCNSFDMLVKKPVPSGTGSETFEAWSTRQLLREISRYSLSVSGSTQASCVLTGEKPII